MKKATWAVLAGVIGSAVGAALLTRWSRRLTSESSRLDALIGGDEADMDLEYARMAKGII